MRCIRISKKLPIIFLICFYEILSFLRKCHLPSLDEIFTWPSISSHLTHNNLKPQKSWQNAMSFHMCMCVLKTQTLLPSLLNDIRINSNMRTSEMNQEKMKTSFACRSYSCMQNRMPYLSTKSFWKMHHIIILNSIFNTSVYCRIFIFAYLNVWAFKH